MKRELDEGTSFDAKVRKFMGGPFLALPRGVLRYLKVKPGDSIQIQVSNQIVKISTEVKPTTKELTPEELVKHFISH